ncbi:MAG TPA: serine hydrolase domain-containing protein, partial [Ilumatobacteraceae bacterium]|nr:serine hydrolase domain-containing protein [Ilumatobacteraceae bacterium]
EQDVAVAPDTIWRIYSMTKPVTSVAAMMLWEEGLFELHDPVAKFIPEFADVKVWRGGSVTRPDLEPLLRPMEMWHLFTHTAGLTYGFMYNH